MKSIRIVTDSTCDIPAPLLERYGISVVPISIAFGQENFHEGVDLTSDDFYRRIGEANALPQASQPPPGAFARVFQELASTASSIICIDITGVHSGTLNSAKMAAEMVPEADVAVFDSGSISLGLGFQVLAAARAAEMGRTKDEILQMLAGMRERMLHYICLDTVKFLQMGGRISSFQSLFATMLDVKPMLWVKNGYLAPLERVRTRQKSLHRLIEVMEKGLGADVPVRLAVMQSRARAEATQVYDALCSKLNVVESFTGDLALSLTVHGGPGLVGAIGYTVQDGEP